MADSYLRLLGDLEAEYAALDGILTALDAEGWTTATPAAPYAVSDQVFHLAYSEELATVALVDPSGFASRLAALMESIDSYEATAAEAAAALGPDGLLDYWRTQRSRTLDALRRTAASARVPWVAGDMSARSFATARLMETWAHGQDVVDGLGIERPSTSRLRHIAELGVRTRAFSYRNRGAEPPGTDVRVELVGPDGSRWDWGPPDAADGVLGPAQDFCLVVTQRRHVDDTALRCEGQWAREWMEVAQAFAGPATSGRPAGLFSLAEGRP